MFVDSLGCLRNAMVKSLWFVAFKLGLGMPPPPLWEALFRYPPGEKGPRAPGLSQYEWDEIQTMSPEFLFTN